MSNNLFSDNMDALFEVKDMDNPLFGCSEYFVGDLCRSVPLLNKYENITRIVTDYRTKDALTEIEL